MKISKMLLETMLGTKVENVAGRRSGKSTGTALSIIGKAMCNPDVSIHIVEVDNTHSMNRNLATLVESLITKLELKHFYINYSKGLVVYKPFIDISN